MTARTEAARTRQALRDLALDLHGAAIRSGNRAAAIAYHDAATRVGKVAMGLAVAPRGAGTPPEWAAANDTTTEGPQ